MLFGFAFCRIRLDLEPDAVYFRMVWGPIGFAFAYITIVWLLNKMGGLFVSGSDKLLLKRQLPSL